MLNFFYTTSILVFCTLTAATALAQQNNTGYYSTSIKQAIAAQKHLKVHSARIQTQSLRQLNTQQLGEVRVKGAIGATAAGNEAKLAKQDKDKLELVKNDSSVDTITTPLKTPKLLSPIKINISTPASINQGSYTGKGYRSSFYNIRGNSEINAQKLN